MEDRVVDPRVRPGALCGKVQFCRALAGVCSWYLVRNALNSVKWRISNRLEGMLRGGSKRAKYLFLLKLNGTLESFPSIFSTVLWKLSAVATSATWYQ